MFMHVRDILASRYQELFASRSKGESISLGNEPKDTSEVKERVVRSVEKTVGEYEVETSFGDERLCFGRENQTKVFLRQKSGSGNSMLLYLTPESAVALAEALVEGVKAVHPHKELFSYGKSSLSREEAESMVTAIAKEDIIPFEDSFMGVRTVVSKLTDGDLQAVLDASRKTRRIKK